MQLICGINPVLEALGAGARHFDRLLVVKGVRNRRVAEAIARASQRGVPLRFEARETLDRMSGGLPHQGVIAVVSAKGVLDLDALLAQAREPAFVVVLDGVEDPRNLGAVLRTVECAGADGVVVPERHSAGLSEAASRASAGALEHVKVARVGNLAQAIERMKSRGLWVVGFDAEGRERWDAVDLKRPVAVVLGGEGRGIRRLVREKCDHLVSLPLFGHVASLNVSVAAGIALYEVVRQRGATPTHVRPIPLKKPQVVEPIVGPAPEDQEADPGAVAARLRALRGQEAPAEADEESAPLVDIHEEAAWSGGGGPTLVVRREREHDRDGRGRRRRGRGRGEERAPRPPSAEATAPEREGEAQGEPGEAGRRRRRRRRKHRRPDAVGGGGNAPSAQGGGAASEPPGAPTASTGGSPGAPGFAAGHRRRRRRRHRRR
ncbi:MAG TPA: 23S rRNA (guanosine(2251)-2'-O)-methyltransferase RlmB [Vicinamibacteria bacterium]|nr:23S rRNA (guanosine(2251)-2'-O)-methyltransferase RlmB [Vicinamibacteria bacterium]